MAPPGFPGYNHSAVKTPLLMVTMGLRASQGPQTKAFIPPVTRDRFLCVLLELKFTVVYQLKLPQPILVPFIPSLPLASGAVVPLIEFWFDCPEYHPEMTGLWTSLSSGHRSSDNVWGWCL